MRLLTLLGLIAMLLAPARPAVGGEPPRPSRGLDDRIEAALERAHQLPPALREKLGTLAGRAVLAERAADLGARRLGERAWRSLATLIETRFTDAPLRPRTEDDPLLAWLRSEAEAYEADLADVEEVVLRVGPALEGEGAVVDALRTFLAREDAADLLTAQFVAPRLRPAPLARVTRRVFVRGDDGAWAIPPALRDASDDVLDAARKASSPASVPHPEAVRLEGRALARRVPADEPAWREALRDGPTAMRLAGVLPAPTNTPRARRVLLEMTPFGRALVGRGEHLRLNPHTVYEVDAWLGALETRARDRAGLAAGLDAFQAQLAEGAALDPLRGRGGRAALRRWITWTIEAEAPPPLDPLLDAVLETLAGSRVEQASFLKRVSRVARELEAEGMTTKLRLEGLALAADHLPLLRSSIFYNPRTAAGSWAYATSFPDHHTARLFGTFGWNAHKSTDLASFRQRVERSLPGLRRLARTHERLIFVINRMPVWLSRSKDTGTFEGGNTANAEAHPPRDVEAWTALIHSFVEVTRQVEGVERYYEFWNEPDLRYWQGTLDEFLALYAVTARAIRAADPVAKIGGPAVNQWDASISKAEKARGGERVVPALVRFATREELPLDFVSWHHFGRPLPVLKQAKRAFENVLREVDAPSDVEFLVTEWSSPARSTLYGGALFADVMFALYEAGVDGQTASCLEEFHARPDPKGFEPWGLITQQAVRKDLWHVHRFFDRLSRQSRGVAVVREGQRTLLLSDEGDGVWELVVWTKGRAPALGKALAYLEAQGLERRDLLPYQTTARLEEAIRARAPRAEGHRRVFEQARHILRGHAAPDAWLRLVLEGSAAIEVLEAEAAKMGVRTKEVRVLGNALACRLDPFEVLRLKIRVSDR